MHPGFAAPSIAALGDVELLPDLVRPVSRCDTRDALAELIMAIRSFGVEPGPVAQRRQYELAGAIRLWEDG